MANTWDSSFVYPTAAYIRRKPLSIPFSSHIMQFARKWSYSCRWETVRVVLNCGPQILYFE